MYVNGVNYYRFPEWQDADWSEVKSEKVGGIEIQSKEFDTVRLVKQLKPLLERVLVVLEEKYPG